MWHNYESSPESTDDTCSDCGVIVDQTVTDRVSLPCPVALCLEPSNEGEPCVFVRTDDGVECAYCARSGDTDSDPDGPTDG